MVESSRRVDGHHECIVVEAGRRARKRKWWRMESEVLRVVESTYRLSLFTAAVASESIRSRSCGAASTIFFACEAKNLQ